MLRNYRELWRVTASAFFCLLVMSCGGDEHVSLKVFLRTDYQPLREFLSAEITVDSHPESRLARIDGGYIRPGEPVADFSNLSLSDNRAVTIRLLRLGGNVLDESTVYIAHDRDLVLTIAVTRDCEGVTCNDIGGAPARCLAGKCVNAKCLTGAEPECEEAECNTDDDCPTESPCATPTCEAGVCFSDGKTSKCTAPQVCDVASGNCFDPPTGCESEADCLNTSECVTAICASELCIYKPVDNGLACSIGECASGICTEDPCTNGRQDIDETDVDCGGSTCAACGLGLMCSQHTDCQSNACDDAGSGTCEDANMCGNGKIEGTESCDDGDVIAGDGCDGMCLLEEGQACSDSGMCASGACDLAGSSTCVAAGVCGNNILETGESCDDGGMSPGDGCSANCLFEDGRDCIDSGECESGVCDTQDSGTCEPADTCGNGTVEGSEGCDDGGVNAGDGCDTNCLIENGGPCMINSQCQSMACDIAGSGTCVLAGVCGNNIIEAGESCDGGNALPGDGCSAMCLFEDGQSCSQNGECDSSVCNTQGSNTCEPANTCGNGAVEGVEACDDGDTVNGDGCNNLCKLENGGSCTLDAQCGSGVCDTAGSNTCEPADTCGNGKIEGSESCDDGGTANGDGCSNMCKRENGVACTLDSQCVSNVCDTLGSNTCEAANSCGNGKIEGTEACDDGGTSGGDGCSNLCKRENGVSCTLDSQCASTVCDTLGSNTCEAANTCGNSKIEGSESCDDGGTANGDGCTNLCKRENGVACTLDSQCASNVCDTLGSNTCEAANTCGNGKIEGSESCDDGGTANGDGCTNLCKRENGVVCTLDSQCASTVCDSLGSNTCEAANTCGNSKVEGSEACDDGGTNAGDGCSTMCLLENGSACSDGAQCESTYCDVTCQDPPACGSGPVFPLGTHETGYSWNDPNHLTINGGSLYVSNQDTRTLVKLNTSTGQVEDSYFSAWFQHCDNCVYGAAGAAFHTDGRIYAAARFGGEIRVFNADGSYNSKFGSLGQVFDVEYASGRVYAVDHTGNKIAVFSDAGVPDFNITGLSNPTSVFVDSSNRVLVVDRNNDRVRVYDLLGNWQFDFGSSGTGNGQFIEPYDIAEDSSGNLYVTDYQADRITKFTSAGAYISKYQASGSGDGQFDGLTGIVLDSSDNIYVTELEFSGGNNRVQKFDSSFNHLATWGNSSASGSLNTPRTILEHSNGKYYVGEHFSYRISVFNCDGTFDFAFGTQGSGNGQMNFSAALAQASNGNVYAADYYNNRIQIFDENGTYNSKFGTSGSGNGQLDGPMDIAIDSSDNVYVLDRNNNRIQKFDINGNYLTKWGSAGSGTGQFTFTYSFAIAVDDSDNVYVSDDGQRIQKFTNAGTHLMTFGGVSGDNLGELSRATGMAIDEGNGDLYVADSSSRIIRFNASGTALSQFGSAGWEYASKGEMSYIYDMQLDSAGDLLVLEYGAARVTRYTKAGVPKP